MNSELRIQEREFRTVDSGPRIQDCGRGKHEAGTEARTMAEEPVKQSREARTVAAETVKLEQCPREPRIHNREARIVAKEP